jgi:general stress protein 26
MLTKKEILERLKNTKFAVLATSDGKGLISASQVCIVNIGLDIYIQTDKKFEKFQNIKKITK